MIKIPFAEWCNRYKSAEIMKIGLLEVEISFNEDQIDKISGILVNEYLKE